MVEAKPEIHVWVVLKLPDTISGDVQACSINI